MACRSVESDFVFRLFTTYADDPVTLILDVRGYKYFKRSHISQAFCVRLSANGKALVDYSKSKYRTKWSQGVWWGKHILVYGDPALKRSHPVIDYLVKEGQCTEISYHKAGFEELEELYPFLCTTSVKANSAKSYPSQVVPKLLFLGDLGNANDLDRLEELNIQSVVTIHNHPERTQFPSRFRHLRIELPDIETADISQHFNSVYKLIEDARAAGTAVLVHCGAGVSRSATLCIAYLMRQNLWSLARAHDYCRERRSRIKVNQGFWRALSALQLELHITDRLDPDIDKGSSRRIRKISKDAVGEKVSITFKKAERDTGSSRHLDGKDERQEFGNDSGSDGDGRKRRRNDAVRSSHRDKRSRDKPRRDARRHRGEELDASPIKRRRHNSRDSDRRNSQLAMTGAEPASNLNNTNAAVKLEVTKEGKVMGNLEIEDLGKHGRCILGRAQGCDVKLEHLSISRQHAQLGIDGHGVLTIMDLQSGHGTNVDGMWLRPRVPKALKVGSVICFGASTRKYKVLSIG